MTRAETVRSWVADCSFQDYTFEFIESDMAFYLRASYMEKDTVTGNVEEQKTRLWNISNLSKSEVVATAFKCVLTSMEHRTREWFLYKNRAIYQPHYDVDVLHSISEERAS